MRQGRVLSPLLFVIFINELGITLRKCKIYLFADEALTYFYAKNVKEILQTLNYDINILTDKFKINKLEVNELKMKAMFLSNNTLYEI